MPSKLFNLERTVNPDIHYVARLFGLLEYISTSLTTDRTGTEYIFSEFIWSPMTATPDSPGTII
jgi:hypothetical protein